MMNQERGHGFDRSKWGLGRFKLCGDDFDSVPVENDSDTFRDSEATVTQPVAEVSEATITLSIAEDSQNEQATRATEDQEWVPKQEGISSPKFLGEEEAAIIIQSAFKGLQVRCRYKQIPQLSGSYGHNRKEDLSKVSGCTSTEVQAGDSAENSRVHDTSIASQQRWPHKARAQVPRLKEEWDGSTVSSNISKLRIQNRLEAMTRRERALAYAFSQQLRTCSTKKKAIQDEPHESNMGWSWLERWMATRVPDNSLVGECMSKHLDPISSDQRYSIVKKSLDVTVEEMESCASNDVTVFFENVAATPSKNTGETYKPVKNRLKATRNVPRRKTVPSYHYITQSNNVKAIKGDSSREIEMERRQEDSSAIQV
uniref:Protein IQ-DOMAIN 1 n=1 Tax=Anthurium amnicola TaxID=1678845 RepID=A0A1D1YYX7_9ARAE